MKLRHFVAHVLLFFVPFWLFFYSRFRISRIFHSIFLWYSEWLPIMHCTVRMCCSRLLYCVTYVAPSCVLICSFIPSIKPCDAVFLCAVISSSWYQPSCSSVITTVRLPHCKHSVTFYQQQYDKIQNHNTLRVYYCPEEEHTGLLRQYFHFPRLDYLPVTPL